MKNSVSRAKRETMIAFDEASSLIYVSTHNTDLVKRLRSYHEKHPDLCRHLEDLDYGGACFEIEKGRLSFRLTEPYSLERRAAQGERGNQMRHNLRNQGVSI